MVKQFLKYKFEEMHLLLCRFLSLLVVTCQILNFDHPFYRHFQYLQKCKLLTSYLHRGAPLGHGSRPEHQEKACKTSQLPLVERGRKKRHSPLIFDYVSVLIVIVVVIVIVLLSVVVLVAGTPTLVHRFVLDGNVGWFAFAVHPAQRFGISLASQTM